MSRARSSSAPMPAANHRRLIYELAEKGWRVMQERGILRDARARRPISRTS